MSQFGLGEQAVQAANEGGKFLLSLKNCWIDVHSYIDTVAFATALQNEMAAAGNNPESEQQMDSGGHQMETGSEAKETQKHDEKQQVDDEDDDDTMNVD